MKHGLAGDLPVAQQGADAREIAPAIFGDARLQRAIGDQPGKHGEIGAEAFLGLRREIVEGLNAGVLVLGEVAKI